MLLHFADEETGVQREEMTCPRPHYPQLGTDPGLVSFCLFIYCCCCCFLSPQISLLPPPPSPPPSLSILCPVSPPALVVRERVRGADAGQGLTVLWPTGDSPAHPERPAGWRGTHHAEDSPEHHLSSDVGTCGRAGHRGKDPAPHPSPGCLLHQREGHVPLRRPEGCH